MAHCSEFLQTDGVVTGSSKVKESDSDAGNQVTFRKVGVEAEGYESVRKPIELSELNWELNVFEKDDVSVACGARSYASVCVCARARTCMRGCVGSCARMHTSFPFRTGMLLQAGAGILDRALLVCKNCGSLSIPPE